jgi:hypothetical protein
MASVNPFDLLGDENEDPEVIAAAKPAAAKPAAVKEQPKAAAKPGELARARVPQRPPAHCNV